MPHSPADVITPWTTSREVHKFKHQTLLSEADYWTDKGPAGPLQTAGPDETRKQREQMKHLLLKSATK